MNGIILCEGSTDYAILQYYMARVNNWHDGKSGKFKYREHNKVHKSRTLLRNGDELTIAAVGGCGNLKKGLASVLDSNCISAPDQTDVYNKIVILTDRDETSTEESFISDILEAFKMYSVTAESTLENNKWVSCKMPNSFGENIDFQILLLIVPFYEKGALETFLLDAVANEDAYDAQIVSQCSRFVDTTDTERKYLTKRRYITKAKFDAFFCIRTAAEQFEERQSILKNVPWENYQTVQECFSLLGEL